MGSTLTLEVIGGFTDLNDIYSNQVPESIPLIGTIKQKVYNILVQRDGTFLGSFYTINPQKWIKKLIIKHNGKPLRLNEEMEKKLIEYLALSDEEQIEKECTWFYKFITWEEANIYFEKEKRDIQEFSYGENPSNWNIIMICPQKYNPKKSIEHQNVHFAAYIWDGIYISKIGSREKFNLSNIKILTWLYENKIPISSWSNEKNNVYVYLLNKKSPEV